MPSFWLLISYLLGTEVTKRPPKFENGLLVANNRQQQHVTNSSRPVSSGSWKMGPDTKRQYSLLLRLVPRIKRTGENNLLYALSTEFFFSSFDK